MYLCGLESKQAGRKLKKTIMQDSVTQIQLFDEPSKQKSSSWSGRFDSIHSSNKTAQHGNFFKWASKETPTNKFTQKNKKQSSNQHLNQRPNCERESCVRGQFDRLSE